MTSDPNNRTAKYLWNQIPQVYRTRDAENERVPGQGDLALIVDAVGELLDDLRSTIDQRLAEIAPDATDKPYDNDGRHPQAWLLPYYADLLGVTLRSPTPEGQAHEVANAIRWRQAKGTLWVARQSSEVVFQHTVELHEGIDLVAVAPRTPSSDDAAVGAAAIAPHVNRIGRSGRITDATPSQLRSRFLLDGWDVRVAPPLIDDSFLPGDLTNVQLDELRAAYTPEELLAYGQAERVDAFTRLNGIGELTAEKIIEAAQRFGDDVRSVKINPNDIPCFPDSYEDATRKTPDSRRPGSASSRHHPRRVAVYVAPPLGFFPPPVRSLFKDGDGTVVPPADVTIVESTELEDLSVGSLTISHGQVTLKNVTLRGDISISAEAVVTLIDTTQTTAASVTVADGGRLELVRSAVGAVKCNGLGPHANDPHVELPGPLTEQDAIVAVDSLLQSVDTKSRATFDSCTILDASRAASVRASDTILAGPFTLTGNGSSCVRYSAISSLAAADPAHVIDAFRSTTDAPLFIGELSCEATETPAPFGTAGCAVLSLDCSDRIRSGAEDGGEMGTYRHRGYAAGVRALEQIIDDTAPIGIKPVLISDSRLLHRPPEVIEATEETP